MKGRIKTIWKDSKWGFITGDDGVDYHFEFRDSLNWKGTWRKDYIVEFDPSTNDRKDSKWYDQPIAVNVRKVGHGKHHPFALDAQQLGDFIMKYTSDDLELKQYMLKNVDRIYKYFCTVEDCEQYPNPRQIFGGDSDA